MKRSCYNGPQESGGRADGWGYNHRMNGQDPKHFALIAEALHWLVDNQRRQPTLGELADRMGYSESHLQRIFQDFAGVTPKQFLKFLTRQQALERLRAGRSVLDTSLDCGLSGPGRLHDLMLTTEAMTPGEVRKKGQGVDMQYGNGMTPFGPAWVAWTGRGITFLGFSQQKGSAAVLAEMQGQWPAARLTESAQEAEEWLLRIFDESRRQPLKIWLRGSPFQLKVWEALLSIPRSAHCTYGQIAASLGKPSASRAVGTAIGRNPVSWLIPCHRVITSAGTLGGYRWGISTKQAMLGLETARDFARPEAA